MIEDAPAVQCVGVESPRGYRWIQARQGFRRCLRQSVDQVEEGFQHLRRPHRASQGTEFRDIARVIHGSGTVRVGSGDGFFAAADPAVWWNGRSLLDEQAAYLSKSGEKAEKRLLIETAGTRIERPGTDKATAERLAVPSFAKPS